MIEIRHEKLNIEKPYRCIVVSDIHSHLDRFKQLLKEARYTTQDYLIIDGDFVEKGTQAIETVHYLQYLQQKSQRVYVLLGNCEYALDALIAFFIINNSSKDWQSYSCFRVNASLFCS